MKTILEILAENDGALEDTLKAIELLIDELQHGKTEEWENVTLESFLDAMHAWLSAVGPGVQGQPSWKLIEHMMLAAKIYE